MARSLRPEDPRCGREHFDMRAGVDWDWGPSPNETKYSIPDTPWNQINHGPRLLAEHGQWAVTEFGLELLSASREKYERYRISGASLLQTYKSAGVYHWPIIVASENWVTFEDFELAFLVAVHVHHRPKSARVSQERWFQEIIAELTADPSKITEFESWFVDGAKLDRTFRRAHGMIDRRDRVRLA
jgi:hypothetical protein